MKVTRSTSTELFVGPDDEPLQVVAVTLVNSGDAAWTADAPATVEVAGDRLGTARPLVVRDVVPGGEVHVEVGVAAGRGLRPGDVVPAEVRAAAGTRTDRRPFAFVVAEAGWRMFMVSHFHYDPVWWNTQAFYTETWEKLPVEQRPWEGRRQQPAFTLIDAHVDMARRDPDYKFVLAELDYLKPYWDVFPGERSYLRRLLAEGRLELMGGTYNEANTNLTSAESTARNAVYGVGYQRDVLGGAPATAWQLDVFGHDPQFPGMMADAGLDSSSWARGPFHQWGPSRATGGNPRMQFDSEFDWVSPSGRGLLTSYMPNHYSAGWDLDRAPTLADAEAEALRLFTELKAVAATRNVLLPVGTDYTPPNRWITAIHRHWKSRYTWPRFEVALPREFFDAVRSELEERGGASPQTRDMNPVYTGKDVSYIDTKQAQRAGENILLAAEKFATVAALLGAGYPTEAFDKAWRQLLFGAHHDGITGTESDQVYLDLLGGWRDTWELAREALDAALNHIGAQVDTRGDGQPLAVFNALSWPRTDVARAEIELDRPAPAVRLTDDTGAAVPFAVEAEHRDAAGRLRGCVLVFVATDVPGVGYRTYRLHPADVLPDDARWQRVEGHRITNGVYELEVDPNRGGAICELVDRRDGRSVLKPGELGNELLAYDEYPTHPDQGEGPWHLLPRGTVWSAAGQPAIVAKERSAVGERIVAHGTLSGCDTVQEVALYAGVPRVECVTHLDGFSGQDTLFRMRVAADVAGGMPISEVGNAVVGRGFGFPLVDAADVPYTLDNPAYNWFGVGATARVRLREPGRTGERASRAISVAEVVAPADWVTGAAVRKLVVALVRTGVTSTVSRAAGSRYGSIDADSNLPDVRIAVGGPDVNPFVAEVLDAVDQRYRAALDRRLAAGGAARVWVPAEHPLHRVWRPNADLRGVRDLPVLLVAGADRATTEAGMTALCEDLADAVVDVVDVVQPADLDGGEGQVDDYTVAVCNRGLPSFNVDARGDLHLSFLRSCSGWPSGVWLDPPRRTAPDGSSFSFQHWTHHFEYALVAGAGDWRATGMVRAGHEHNTPLHVRQLAVHTGTLPAAATLVHVGSDDVVLTAMKPAGNPMARMAGTAADPSEGITLRCYEAHGRPADVEIALFRPLREAYVTDLLEESRRQVRLTAGTVRHRLEPYGIATFGAVVAERPAATDRGVSLGRRQEPAQPVYSDYWLHNKGAAPIGYQPVTVQIPPRAIAADGAFDVPVLVASERTDDAVAGTVEVVVPTGWHVDPARHAYRLAPGSHLPMSVTVTPPPDAGPGRYFVAARIRDEAGQVHEDVVTVDLGPALPWPGAPRVEGEVSRSLLLDRATRKAVIVDRRPDATTAALGGELGVDLRTAAVELEPGETAAVEVALANLVAGEIHGEAQVISPWGTWEHVAPWTQGFAVAAGATGTVRFTVRCPTTVRPTTAWALVKIMYFGRVLYTPSLELRLAGARARVAVEGPASAW